MISDGGREVLKLFAEGRELYKEKNFSEALKKFEAALLIDKNDGPSQVFVERCKKFMETPPPEGWDGVYDMETK